MPMGISVFLYGVNATDKGARQGLNDGKVDLAQKRAS